MIGKNLRKWTKMVTETINSKAQPRNQQICFILLKYFPLILGVAEPVTGVRDGHGLRQDRQEGEGV